MTTATLVERLPEDAAVRSMLVPLAAYLADAALNELCINRPGQVMTEATGEWITYPIPELTYAYTRMLAGAIARFNGKWIDNDHPICSGTLPGGERVELLVPPACQPETVVIVIRKPSLIDRSLDELEQQGSFAHAEWVTAGAPYTESDLNHSTLKPVERDLLQRLHANDIHGFLETAVCGKRNVVLSGKTASGKTTVTRSLINYIPAHERIITIEDAHELFMPNRANRVHLFYSRADAIGSKVTAKMALASCMRLRPDRVLLAEVRGDEAWDYIQSINTGHPGSITSCHANGALHTFGRLTNLAMMDATGRELGHAYIERAMFTTIDIVLYYEMRRLKELYYDPLHARRLLVSQH